MKSKVKFDITEDNQPIIVAEFNNSDDLRDKIAQRFRDNIGYTQFLYGHFEYIGNPGVGQLQSFVISPVGPSYEALKTLKALVDAEIEARDLTKVPK